MILQFLIRDSAVLKNCSLFPKYKAGSELWVSESALWWTTQELLPVSHKMKLTLRTIKDTGHGHWTQVIIQNWILVNNRTQKAMEKRKKTQKAWNTGHRERMHGPQFKDEWCWIESIPILMAKLEDRSPSERRKAGCDSWEWVMNA